MPLKRKKPRGFTDRLYSYNLSFVFGLTVVSLLLIIATAFSPQIMDLSPLSYILPSAYSQLAIHTGFVIWKAKAENIRKYPRITSGVQQLENEFNQFQYNEGVNENV